MNVWCCVCCSVVSLMLYVRPAAAVVGGAPAVAPEPDAAVVFVQKNGRSARIEGIKDNKLAYYSFLGMRCVTFNFQSYC